jgi:hypothetical protein
VAERFFPDGKTYVECCFECANKPNCKHGGKKDDVVPGSISWNECAFCETEKMTKEHNFDCLDPGCSNKPLCYECADEITSSKGDKLSAREKRKPEKLKLKNRLKK